MKILLSICFLLFPSVIFAQNKDCDIEKLPNPKGGQVEYAITHTSLGKFMVGKQDGSIGFGYMPKTMQAMSTASSVSLKLDSAIFVFEDYSTLRVAVQGQGQASNKVALKPALVSCYLGATLTDEQITMFKSKLVTAMQVKGEKESEGGDVLNEKARAQFQKSFTCIQ
jgi:hypothetical protein